MGTSLWTTAGRLPDGRTGPALTGRRQRPTLQRSPAGGPGSTMSARPPRLSRDAILDTARTMIVARGIDGFSLRRLAAHLGVTAPSLYRFFDSKDAIVAAIAEAAFEQLIDAIDGAAAGHDDPIERIKAQSVAYVECAVANPALFAVMFAYRPPWADRAERARAAPGVEGVGAGVGRGGRGDRAGPTPRARPRARRAHDLVRGPRRGDRAHDRCAHAPAARPRARDVGGGRGRRRPRGAGAAAR